MVAVEYARAIYYCFSAKLRSWKASSLTEEEIELLIKDEAVSATQQFADLLNDVVRKSKCVQDCIPKVHRLAVAEFRHRMVKAVAGFVQTLRACLNDVARAVKTAAVCVLMLLEEMRVKAEWAAAKAIELITGGSGSDDSPPTLALGMMVKRAAVSM